MVMLAACADVLDTKYQGGLITEDQKKKAGEANPALFEADVNSMYAIMIEYQGGSSWTSYTYHNDFGTAALAMMMESNGQDFVGPFLLRP